MTTWKIDPAHSEVNFNVKHLLVSTVRGHFDKFDANIETNKEDFSDAKIEYEADVKSINTQNEERDAHLKSADFFDAENNPKMIFKSTSVKKVSDYLCQRHCSRWRDGRGPSFNPWRQRLDYPQCAAPFPCLL